MSEGAHAATLEIDGPRRTLIVFSLTAATMMQTLDNTIANVALPRMQGSFSATQDQMAWVLTSYIIASAIMIPLSGWLAGRIGRKQVFLFSVAGFTIASMLCGLSQSLPQIVMARLLQGVSGAALVPLSQAALLDITPVARQPRAMSLWAMATSLGPIMGPALGGWLTENYNWRWVFFINVPIGVLAFIGMASSLPATTTHKSPFDFFGFTSLSVGLGALPVDARSRPDQGLVRLNGDLDRSSDRAGALLPLRRAHADDDRATLYQPSALQGPKLHRWKRECSSSSAWSCSPPWRSCLRCSRTS